MAKTPEAKTDAERDPLVRARREKLERWRNDLDVEPYGRRVEGIVTLADARALYDEGAHQRFEETSATDAVVDDRPHAVVAGRCVQHRLMGSLAFIVLRDHSGDLQISVSKKAVDPVAFKLAALYRF